MALNQKQFTFFSLNDSGFVFGESDVHVVNDIVVGAEATFPEDFSEAGLSKLLKILSSELNGVGFDFLKVEDVFFVLDYERVTLSVRTILHLEHWVNLSMTS